MNVSSFFRTNKRIKVGAVILIVLTEWISFVTYTEDDSFTTYLTASNRELILEEQSKPQDSWTQSGTIGSPSVQLSTTQNVVNNYAKNVEPKTQNSWTQSETIASPAITLPTALNDVNNFVENEQSKPQNSWTQSGAIGSPSVELPATHDYVNNEQSKMKNSWTQSGAVESPTVLLSTTHNYVKNELSKLQNSLTQSEAIGSSTVELPATQNYVNNELSKPQNSMIRSGVISSSVIELPAVHNNLENEQSKPQNSISQSEAIGSPTAELPASHNYVENEQFKPQNSMTQSVAIENPFANHLNDAQVESIAPVKSLVELPAMDGFKNTLDQATESDTPVFWHIAKSGGSTFKDIFVTCHTLTSASEVGIQEGHDQDMDIGAYHMGENGLAKYVNVDTTNIPGLERAENMGLIPSGLAEVVITRQLFEVNSLFDSVHKGRLFAVFRHPVDRAASMFSYLQYADWEPTYNPIFANMTLEDYAGSSYIEDNWLTRILSNSYTDEITPEHVAAAKNLLREKFFVGLLSEKKESMARFEKFFGWKYTFDPHSQEKCRRSYLKSGSNMNLKSGSDKPKPGSSIYEAVASRNRWDIDIYEYVETLFSEQGIELGGASMYRWQGSSCCMCEKPPTCAIAQEEGFDINKVYNKVPDRVKKSD